MLARPLVGGRGSSREHWSTSAGGVPSPASWSSRLWGSKNWAPSKAGLHQDILGFQDLHTGIQPKVPDPGPVLCLCCFIASGLSSVGLRWCVGWRGWEHFWLQASQVRPMVLWK